MHRHPLHLPLTPLKFPPLWRKEHRMSQYWWKDLHDRNHAWLGLELQSPKPTMQPILEMHSGHHGRMALSLRGVPLFWGSMLSVKHPPQAGMIF